MAATSGFSEQAKQIRIRTGQISDCNELAELINESSEGAIDYLFSASHSSGLSLKAMSELLEHEIYYSYVNAIIAELQGKLAGMALCFPSDGLMINDQMRNYYSSEKLQYIRYFVENKIAACWHLDALCVRDKYRGRGIGSHLLSAVKDKASEVGFDSIGVFVFGTNTGAKRFYRRHGFKDLKEIDTTGHEFLGSKKNLCLMRFSG